jgi:hypothetical protein
MEGLMRKKSDLWLDTLRSIVKSEGSDITVGELIELLESGEYFPPFDREGDPQNGGEDSGNDLFPPEDKHGKA